MFPEATPAFHDRFAEVALEAPLRVAVATMEGKIQLWQVDLFLDLLNGRWGALAGRLRRRMAAVVGSS